jgi:hypothetical protein
MPSAPEQTLIDCIADQIAPRGFHTRRRPALENLGCIAFWKLSSLSMNRAVAVVRAPEPGVELGAYAQKLKWKLLWRTWFVPFLYELGVQIVICGEGLRDRVGLPDHLLKHVDRISNQFVVLQSLFVADLSSRQYAGVRTWGQIFTGEYQDAIGRGIERAGFQPMIPAFLDRWNPPRV